MVNIAHVNTNIELRTRVYRCVGSVFVILRITAVLNRFVRSKMLLTNLMRIHSRIKTMTRSKKVQKERHTHKHYQREAYLF